MTSEDATELLYEAVRLADEARDAVNPDAVIALSLGPYGAQHGQEYSGYYPVPFGPGGDHTNSFAPNEVDKEQEARDALARFHYERLLIYAFKSDIWDKIDCLAFETVPLLREAQAIQKAITMLETYLMATQKKMKPWWLSFVFLNGQFPQDSRPNGRKMTVKELVRNLCSPIGDGTIPSGIGVNCTVPKDSVHLLKSLSQEFLQYSIPQPWLVLYPNARGQRYDSIQHSCMDQGNDDTEEELKDKWVAEVGEICQLEGMNRRGLLVGGCCKCGSAYINGLKSLLLRLRAPSNSSD
jgi:homocysteine S-methyltransferase